MERIKEALNAARAERDRRSSDSEVANGVARRLRLFANFEHLGEDARRAVVAAGEVVFSEGDLCDQLFLTLDGALTVWAAGHRVGVMGPGDPFGEMSLHEAPSLATIRAEGPANVLVFPLHEVQLLLKSEIALAAKLTMNREGIRRLAAEELGLPTSPYQFADSLTDLQAAIDGSDGKPVDNFKVEVKDVRRATNEEKKHGHVHGPGGHHH